MPAIAITATGRSSHLVPCGGRDILCSPSVLFTRHTKSRSMSRDHARIVIVGGGVIGASIAYQLTQAGVSDVLVLEKAQLTHGSTWHAAGLVGQLRSKKNLTRLMQNSVAVFDKLEAETGQTIDWRKSGSLRVASSDVRMTEIRRSLTQAQGFGFEAYEISAQEAQDKFPWMSLDGIVGAAWIPSDGYIDPYALTMAFVKGARAGGARFREGVLVTGFDLDGRRVKRVLTNQGEIDCDCVVNAAGIWAKRIGEMAGVALAAGAVEHQYIVTEKKIPVTHDTPTFRDPDRIFYLKPDVKSFAIGGWEKGAPACWPEGVPFDWGRQLFPENMDRFEPILIGAAERLPILNEVGIQTYINGAIPVSADGEPILGLAPELDNFYVACGFTAGIAASGGAGVAMARWILEGDPGMDLWPFDVRRFATQQANRRYLAERSSEAYGSYYAVHWPGEEMESARGARRSPLHRTLFDRGADLRLESRLGAPAVVRHRRRPRARGAELRRQARLVRGGRPRAQGRARARRPHRSDILLEVRDRRPRRCRSVGPHRRQSHRSPCRKLRLYAALQ